jgi:hypothetical protein
MNTSGAGGLYPSEACGLTTRPFLAQHDYATTIEPNDVERVLTDINADYGNRTLCRSHGVLLVLAPLASLSLAGQEHGRTIPLPHMCSIRGDQRSGRQRKQAPAARHRGAAADPGPLIRRALLDIRAVKSSILERNVLRIGEVFAL